MNVNANVNCEEIREQRTIRARDGDSRFQNLYSQYLNLKQDIVILRDKINFLREAAEYKSPSLEGGGGKNSHSDKIGKSAAKILDLKKELGEKQVQMLELWEQITDMICSLNNSTQRRIMIERYINQKRWDTIAREANLCERWVFRLHRKALDALKQQLE